MQKNAPDIWKQLLPIPNADSHKYQRGHALIHGASELTGATNLAATACSRVGAGLTTVIAPEKTDIYQCVLPPDIMVRKEADEGTKNVTAVLAGPGGASTSQADAAMNNPYGAVCILDANAIPISVDGRYPDLANPGVLTPHDGEFAKAFPTLKGTREENAIAAAVLSQAIVVLKGRATIIAAPDRRCIVNEHASPWLSKAGTGDVLAGMITGLVAQKMPVFEACAAACWMHGEAGIQTGPGLVASDLEKKLAAIIADLIS